MHVAHLTSAHHRDDVRIFHKMCRSLTRAGHDVRLIVADGRGQDAVDGVRITDVGRPSGRLWRMMATTRRILRAASAADADVYHLHDPELLPVGLFLKRRGKSVIFDAHEDLPRQILAKSYIPRKLRPGLAAVLGRFEEFACRRLDAVVAATPAIREKFARQGIACVDINNFPMLEEMTPKPRSADSPAIEVCYVGGISRSRGIREMVAAIGRSEIATGLILAGDFQEAGLRTEVAAMDGWRKVTELGFQSRSGIREVLARSCAGLVTLHPTPAYVDALPVKMFEYMAVGIPVIASDFPLWRTIVETADCGICVDPMDARAISAAIDRLLSDPVAAARMGENGRKAVLARYNWGIEERKLLSLYEQIEG
ncbi:MAG: glycosyltransferase family 4 protein [Rhizobiaceae bacterium]